MTVPRSFHPADVCIIDAAMRKCEALGMRDPHELAGLDHDADAVLASGLRGHVVASSGAMAESSGSRVYLMLSPLGGFPDRGMASLPDELAAVLASPQINSKLDKLAATGLAERHLVLAGRLTAFSYPVFDALAFGGPLPGEIANLPSGLTQVWLITGVHDGGVVGAIADQHWTRDYPYDDLPPACWHGRSALPSPARRDPTVVSAS